jgi:hypothetical protein
MGILVRGENKLARTINRGIHFSMNALGWAVDMFEYKMRRCT